MEIRSTFNHRSPLLYEGIGWSHNLIISIGNRTLRFSLLNVKHQRQLTETMNTSEVVYQRKKKKKEDSTE